jgi:hypothetical protein
MLLLTQQPKKKKNDLLHLRLDLLLKPRGSLDVRSSFTAISSPVKKSYQVLQSILASQTSVASWEQQREVLCSMR